MKVLEHIEKANGKTQFSFEILPPLKGQNIQSIFDSIDPLMEFNPPFIDVTYHREEYVYKELENGLLEKKVVRKRPGTVGICAAIQNKYDVDAIPHILCGGFTKEDTENFLIDLDFLGIDNVMALRGDAVKNETYFTPEKKGHAYAEELVKQIDALNRGTYLDAETLNQAQTNFCIGVAGYPEKHAEAPNMESDIHFLKKKLKNGGAYVVTQMFFDNAKFFLFVKKCREAGIEAPIIPGLKPLSSKKQLNLIPQRFNAELPDALIQEVLKCKDSDQVKNVGIEWCIMQSKELMAHGVPFLHFYSMGKSDNIKTVASQLF
ncbi:MULTISPECIES: methylenetetrahydrofolate reductase [NAD(P)H] [Altibacter]|uniref:methylenetetrahydrofolate reductase [NAD(P)H] n=1 Tax=Altibacter TaxID=1535231 RepID=UPI0005520DB5|nr:MULTISPECIES: methylenetetrahydrofolate reductase [NAD(P)H] [Altibacter]MCW8979748.1 methylenetetrahydrofolate reductase [NAD(P)H] [Altibacter sp.]MCW9036693.1 methylenetetrahydrofolate reductase [NAD(P)H] [Altibacter sp.]